MYNMQGYNEEMAQEVNVDWDAVLSSLTQRIGQLEQQSAIKDNIIKQLSDRLDAKETDSNVGDKPKKK